MAQALAMEGASMTGFQSNPKERQQKSRENSNGLALLGPEFRDIP
jgi:hypothetical protein